MGNPVVFGRWFLARVGNLADVLCGFKGPLSSVDLGDLALFLISVILISVISLSLSRRTRWFRSLFEDLRFRQKLSSVDLGDLFDLGNPLSLSFFDVRSSISTKALFCRSRFEPICVCDLGNFDLGNFDLSFLAARSSQTAAESLVKTRQNSVKQE